MTIAMTMLFDKALSDQEVQQLAENPMGFATVEPQKKQMRFGTVLVFKEELTVTEVEAILEALKPALASCAGIKVFDQQYGGPVWYVP